MQYLVIFERNRHLLVAIGSLRVESSCEFAVTLAESAMVCYSFEKK